MSEAILRVLAIQAAVGGGLILVMLGLRAWLRGKVPNALIYGLWLVVAIRMLLPIELPRPAFVPRAPESSIQQTDAQTALARASDAPERLALLETALETDDAASAPSHEEQASAPQSAFAAMPHMGMAQWLVLAWLTGAGALLWYMIWVNGRWRARVLRTARRMRMRTRLPVLLADVASPCLMGVLKPCVVLNADAARPENLRYALAHELSHHRNQDHLWNMLRNVMLVLFWFHPLVWLAAHCSRLDCERACDEQVTRRLGRTASIEYARTLISLVSPGGVALAPSASFMGANLPEIKRRVAQVVAREGRKRWACVVFAGLLVLVTAASFATGEAVVRATPAPDGVDAAEIATPESAAGDGFVALSATNGRVLLPVPPDEMYHYELEFSRPLTDKEQQVWDKLWDEHAKNPNMYSDNPAEIFYTERAYEKLIGAISNPGDAPRYRVGDGSPGTILLDFGTVTVCVGDEKLTRKRAHPLVTMVAPMGRYSPEVDSWYNAIYEEFYWLRALPGGHSSETRHLVQFGMPEPSEFTRHYELMADYMLRGRRASAPIPTSETADGGLWYDADGGVFHLPMQYAMTDEELLQYIDKTAEVRRREALGDVTDIIDERQAIEIASQLARQLYGRDMGALTAFAFITAECHDTGCSLEPRWDIWFAPEDYLLRRFNWYDFTYYEIILDARDGGLHFAGTNAQPDVSAAPDKTIKQLKAELESKAAGIAAMLLPDGTNPGKVDFYRSTWNGYDEPLPDNAKQIPEIVICYLDAPDGAKCQLRYAGGSLALESFHYRSEDYDEGY